MLATYIRCKRNNNLEIWIAGSCCPPQLWCNKRGLLRSGGEKLVRYQENSSCGIMSVILMITLFYKALILQGEIWYWSLLGPKGLSPQLLSQKENRTKSTSSLFSPSYLRYKIFLSKHPLLPPPPPPSLNQHNQNPKFSPVARNNKNQNKGRFI